MSLLDAVKDTVAMETQELDPPGLDAKPGTCILLQAAGGLGRLGGDCAVGFHIGPSFRRRLPPLGSLPGLTLLHVPFTLPLPLPPSHSQPVSGPSHTNLIHTPR